VRQVQAAAVEMREMPNEVNGFGSLSYLKKFDVSASQDAVLGGLFFREGDSVRRGQRVARLENPQIVLAVQRAENSYAQAEAALDLAKAQLLEGEFQAEARILGIGKSEAELAQARRSLEEQKHKLADQETLFTAGGVSSEAIRDARFSLESAEAQIGLMETQLEMQRIGFRDQDLRNAGMSVPASDGERTKALIALSTLTLRAEQSAAQARLEAAEKELASCRLAEAELTVYSPASGIIGARYMEEGERVKKDDKIITVMDTGSLYAIFPAPEAEALKLGKGMAAKVSLDGTSSTYDGKVDLVSPQADSQSFTFMVRVILPAEAVAGSQGSLKPGMFARVSVTVGEPRLAAVIPESSLVSKDNDNGGVFLINGNTLSERKIAIGSVVGDKREILSGLKPGDVVVVRPSPALRDGAYVSVAN
jgi:RND family efflux transporter MFP subunit